MEKKIIKHGDEIVNFAKGISESVNALRIPADVDFMGCSHSYVIEKLNIAISDLEWMKKRVKELKESKLLESK